MENGEEIGVTLLAESETKLSARLKNHSARFMQLLTESAAPPGTAIKLEVGDTLYLGEVRSCHRVESGFTIHVELEHVLHDMEDLTRLARRILGAERF